MRSGRQSLFSCNPNHSLLEEFQEADIMDKLRWELATWSEFTIQQKQSDTSTYCCLYSSQQKRGSLRNHGIWKGRKVPGRQNFLFIINLGLQHRSIHIYSHVVHMCAYMNTYTHSISSTSLDLCNVSFPCLSPSLDYEPLSIYPQCPSQKRSSVLFVEGNNERINESQIQCE